MTTFPAAPPNPLARSLLQTRECTRETLFAFAGAVDLWSIDLVLLDMSVTHLCEKFMGEFNMMKRLKLITLLLIASFVMNQPAFAVPTFQVWSPDYEYAGDWGPDEQTWFVTDSSFELVVAGAFTNGFTSLTNVTLLVSVPDGQTGSITFTGGAPATLLTSQVSLDPPLPGDPCNPTATATLPTIGLNTGFDTLDFLPVAPDDVANYNNHYPLHDDVSDFLVYSIGTFGEGELELIPDYNADPCDPDGVYDPCDPCDDCGGDVILKSYGGGEEFCGECAEGHDTLAKHDIETKWNKKIDRY